MHEATAEVVCIACLNGDHEQPGHGLRCSCPCHGANSVPVPYTLLTDWREVQSVTVQ